MPTESPVQTPVESPSLTPDEEYRGDPEKLCPGQGDQVTRIIAPMLPD